MRVRKQINELTPEDFEKHSCWEYASDEEGRRGQDECTVRPVTVSEALKANHQVFVQAAFFFPNGRVRQGVVTIHTGDDVSSHQPTIFMGKAVVSFYCGAIEPSERELARFRSALKKVCLSPYPVRYVSALHSDTGRPLAVGVLEGLYWLSDWRKGKVNVMV